jgi:hypothetical protein
MGSESAPNDGTRGFPVLFSKSKNDLFGLRILLRSTAEFLMRLPIFRGTDTEPPTAVEPRYALRCIFTGVMITVSIPDALWRVETDRIEVGFADDVYPHGVLLLH